MADIPPIQSMPSPFMPDPPKKSTWPTVIGVLSTVFGILGITCLSLSFLIQAVPGLNTQQTSQASLPEWHQMYSRISSGFGLIFSVVELFAGITLLKRRPAARPLHLILAFAGILSTVIGNVVVILLSLEQASSAPWMFISSMLVGSAVGLAYPVFLLIWFYRRKIIDEVNSWKPDPYTA